MATDWSIVTVDHVRRACALHDAGTAVPRSPARNTILLMGGNRYPAKFIRGLAYKLATGGPPGDYSGGLATVVFFSALGLTTEHDGKMICPPASPVTPALSSSPTPLVPPTVTPSAPAPATPPVPGGKVDQKKALLALLTARFGTVEKEATFAWLTVPAEAAMTGPIAAVHTALRAHRGHANFATAGRRLNCDFHVPGHKLLVEYDERQHFTVPRGVALGLYPASCKLHFDRAAWIADCHKTRANDPTPLYRDEQRAFYDALRDLRAAENGYTLVRLRDRAYDWTRPDAGARLDAVLAACGIGPTRTAGAGGVGDRIARLALVSHDYRKRDGAGRWDYSEHVERINRLCDEAGCDTILYALYTWDTRSATPRTAETMFGGTSNLRRVVVEVGDFGANGGNPGLGDLSVEGWERGRENPRVVRQRFATSKEGWADAANLLADLPDRRLAADGVVMVCGEANAVSLVRATKKMYDPHKVNDRLGALGVRVVLNPIHDYMRRYEMREKRRHFSTGGRWVASVWNVGKGRESATPWTLFRDGAEVTGVVKEIQTPFPDRPDIRVGVVDLV